MAERKFEVKMVSAEGRVLVNKTVQTLKNGFFELWLPRDQRFELTISGMNREAGGIIETFSNSSTCITNMRLK